METIYLYFVKSSALIALFFLVYHLFLRKETFFTSNRWFLLTGLVTSALLPLLSIKKVVYVKRPMVNLDEALLSYPTGTAYETAPQTIEIDWFQIGFWVYGIVALLLFVKVIYNSYSLYKTLHKRQILKDENFLFVDVEEDVAPFSFFNFIVFNSRLYSTTELHSILSHEKIHSAQKHSIDVLITKVFSIVFWFNPFMYLYKKAIVQNLEYIADQRAIELIQDKKSYQMTLLKVVSHQNCLPITNHFYQSLIKKRIIMLNQNQSHKRNSWKYTLVLPALVAFFMLFQIKVVAQEVRIVKTNSSIDAVYVTTDKNSSDAEMKKDAQLVKEQFGVTLKFSKVKRNAKGEITGIKVTYKDKDGNTGTTQFDGKEPIKPIYFYKTPNKIGFGKNNNVMVYSSGRSGNVPSEEELDMGTADMDFDVDLDTDVDVDVDVDVDTDVNESRIVIQKDGQRPTVIVNGKVIENGMGIDVEKLEKLRELNSGFAYQLDNGQMKVMADIDIEKLKSEAMENANVQIRRMNPEIRKQVDGQMKNARKQMERAREEMDRAREEMDRERPRMEKELREMEKNRPEMEKARAEMEKAREEMLKAKADLLKARAELEKAKSDLKR